MKSARWIAYGAIVLSLSGLSVVHAESTAVTSAPADKPAKVGACKADSDKFCAGKQGKDRILCLKEHQSELSTECTAKMDRMQKRHEAFKAACADDREKLCKDVQPGKGGLMQCLKSHESELTTACKDLVAKMPAKAKAK